MGVEEVAVVEEILIQMECGAPERHQRGCMLPRKAEEAWHGHRWASWAALAVQVRDRTCGCRGASAVDRCSFSGAVDVELSGPERLGTWTCPRCQTVHREVEV